MLYNKLNNKDIQATDIWLQSLKINEPFRN